MKLSKCCDAEIKFGMVDDRVGHGIHEETECSNCGELYPESYDDEEEECKHETIKFYLMVKGPKAYLPEGTRYEEHELIKEDLEQEIEDGDFDTLEEAIDYYIQDEIDGWGQHWCTAIPITKEEYERLTP
jgi:hypothetical protein